MELQQYIIGKKEFYDSLLTFLDSEEDNYLRDQSSLISNFNKLKKVGNKEEFKSFLCLIIQIAHNHHRTTDFNQKIEQILLYFKDDIKKNLTNLEIFNLFKSHKRILLFLLQNDFVTVDQFIFEYLSKNVFYRHFFEPEIQSFFNEKDLKKNKKSTPSDEFFEQKRKIGENDSNLCQMIRQDSIDEFVTFVTRTNLNLSTKIKRSTFETNSFLIMKDPTLIEYAAFYGSFQIFKFLQLNNVDLNPSLWFYVIHGQNPELIHLLEENNVVPDDHSYESCLIESIKCHHNDIARYIFDNLYTKSNYEQFDEIVLESIFRYYNYSFFPENIDQNNSFYYLCQYNYVNLVDLFIKVKKDDIESILIFNYFFLVLSCSYTYKIFF